MSTEDSIPVRRRSLRFPHLFKHAHQIAPQKLQDHFIGMPAHHQALRKRRQLADILGPLGASSNP